MEDYEVKDYTYRLVELRDEMLSSIENAKKVNGQSALLNDIIEASDHKEEMQFFLDSSREQIENTEKQIESLNKRVALLDDAIAKLKDNAEGVELLSIVFDALGIFRNE